MPHQKLAKAGAMAIGSELWIVPNPEASPWARKIDWYLNFQMARASSHQPAKLSVDLQNLLEENEVEFAPMSSSVKNLMVATQLRVPAHQVVLVPFEGEKNQWLKSCKNIWEQLGFPKLRLFLPVEIKDSDVQKLWGEPRDNEGELTDLTFVPGDLSLEA